MQRETFTMTIKPKGGAKAPPIPVDRLRSHDTFAALLRELEPNWAQPSIEALDELIMLIDSGGARTKRKTSEQPGEIEKAVEVLRRAARARLRQIERGELVFSTVSLTEPENGVADAARHTDPRPHLRDLVAWFADRDAVEIALFDFGAPVHERSEPSWYTQCRRLAPLLAQAWHPHNATHPVSETSSIVKVLYWMLVASGEDGTPGNCTPPGVKNFLGRERDLLGRPG